MRMGMSMGLAPPSRSGEVIIPPDVPYPVFPFTSMGSLRRKSDVNGGAGIAAITDVTSDGANAIRVVVPVSDVLLQPTAVRAPIDMSNGGSLRIRFKPIANVSTLNRAQLELRSGTSLTQTTNIHTTAPFNTNSDVRARATGGVPEQPNPGRMQEYSVALSAFTAVGTGADLSAITSASWRLRSSGGAATIEGVDIEYVPNPRPRAACVFFLDDSDISHYTYVFPAMQALGFVGMLYPSPYQSVLGAPGKMTKDNVLEMQAAGWQIASQAWDTEDATIVNAAGPTALEASFDALRAAQRADGFYEGYDGSYFANVNFQDMIVNSAFRNKFRTARSFYLGGGPMPSTPPALHGETWPIGDRFNIRAFSGASPGFGSTMGASLQALAEQAIAAKGFMMPGYHEELGNPGNARNGFNSLISFLDANRATIEVTTLKRLLG